MNQAYPRIIRFIQQHMPPTKSMRENPMPDDDFDEAHMHGLLAQWAAGATPEQIKHYLSRAYTRQQLQSAVQAINAPEHPGNAAYVQLKTCSTSEFQRQSAQFNMHYGMVDTPFGNALIGFTQDGICHLSFHDVSDAPETHLRQRWPTGKLSRDSANAQSYVEQIFQSSGAPKPIPAWTYGTDFQIRVWRALMQLPSGGLMTYQQLAAQAGAPGAARAAGSAMANNRLAWLIPCHRVLRQSGDFGQYGGGTERKMAMVAYEAARLA